MDGIAASPGIAIGKGFLFLKEKKEIDITKITKEQIEEELKKFREAINLAKDSIDNIKNQTEKRFGSTKAEIFEAHLMFLEDPEFITGIETEIKDNRLKAEVAVNKVVEQYIQFLAELDDEYILARQTDIRDVGDRVIGIIQGKKSNVHNLPLNSIVIAEDLTPSDIVQLDPKRVIAFVTSGGSRTSHTSIIARSLGIPAVVGLGQELLEQIVNGQEIIVDGLEGKVILEPDEEIKERYKMKNKLYQDRQKHLRKFTDRKAITLDGFEIEIAGNVGNLSDLEAVLQQGGDSIGLFRTEFLYMNREQLPTEEEQFEIYKIAAEKAAGKEVIIRTLDVGGDKDIAYMKLPAEMNPFLGYRAIRVCIDRPEIFKPQLKALLRASVYGNIKIMFPMITTPEELSAASSLLSTCKEELAAEGKEYNPDIEVGIMIETPAAVMIAEELAKEVDFFSIGTNDLIQYTMAVDRTNERVSALHSPYHSSILRLIDKVVKAAHQGGISVGMCGEAAGEELLIPFWIGIGLDELSMNAFSILKAKEIVCNWSKEEAGMLADRVLAMGSSQEIKDYLVSVKKEENN